MKVVLKKSTPKDARRSTPASPALATYRVEQDFLRNARLISQSDEPAFAHEFAVPKGASRLVVETRRANLKVTFFR